MPDPRYRVIAQDLREKIESHELPGGSQLKKELDLMEEYDASRNTVRDAMRLLETRGLIEKRPGKGTFVVERIVPFVTTLDLKTGPGSEGAAYTAVVSSTGRTPKDTVPRVEIQQASGMVAAELGLAEGATIVSRHQERRIDGTPYSLQTTFYPMDLVEKGAIRIIQAEHINEGAVRYIEEATGIKQAGWRDRFTVRAPDTHETGFFGLSPDGRVAVFEIFRTGYDEPGKPLRLTVTIYPTDRNQFTQNVGKVPLDRSESADQGSG
jgi:GntR family transcriptional regulator